MKINKKVFAVTSLLLLSLFANGQELDDATLASQKEALMWIEQAADDFENERYQSATSKLLLSIELDSNFERAYFWLYQTGLKHLEEHEKIMVALQKGKRVFPENDELRFYCGEVYRAASNDEAALAEYSEAIEYSLKNGERSFLVEFYYLNRGNIHLKNERLALALKDYNYLIELDSNSTSGLTNRGITFFKLGKTKEACKDWSLAVEKGFYGTSDYVSRYCVGR